MKTLKVEDYMNLPYTIETKRENDGSYFIKVKELPGCMSYGETLEEAYEMIKDAMQAWIAVQLEDGHEVPMPVTSEYSGRFNVRIPRDLHKMLAENAKDEGISLNAYVNFLLSSNNERYQALKERLEDKDKTIEKLCLNRMPWNSGQQFTKGQYFEWCIAEDSGQWTSNPLPVLHEKRKHV